MTRYSAWSLIRAGLDGQTRWTPAWRDAAPKSTYDVVIVGGGGHGLATAYALAKTHGVKNVAVLEKAWIGGGGTGRNTTVIRSNYFHPESAAFYNRALSLYETLSRELEFNIMFSPRGLWSLGHSRHDAEILRRTANAMRLNGVDVEFVDAEATHRRLPGLNPNPRFPVTAALWQRRAGIARHDAVAWAYARAASALGVDIIQGCEVHRIAVENDQVVGVETSRGRIAAGAIGLAAAAHTDSLCRSIGVRLPIVSHALQAFVTEPVKPVLDPIVVSGATGVYVSQTDKGELLIGGGLDAYPSFAQRGAPAGWEAAAAHVLELFPQFSRLRFLRQWSGTCDVTPDRSPIIDAVGPQGLYVNCGWGTGGFKAIPAGGLCFAELVATGRAHPLAAGFSLNRFQTGDLVDEAAAAVVSH